MLLLLLRVHAGRRMSVPLLLMRLLVKLLLRVVHMLLWMLVLLLAEDVRIPLQDGTQQLRIGLRRFRLAIIVVPLVPNCVKTEEEKC